MKSVYRTFETLVTTVGLDLRISSSCYNMVLLSSVSSAIILGVHQKLFS